MSSGQSAGAAALSALSGADDRLHELDWYPVVKKEFADTIRTRAIVILSVLYLAMFVLPLVVLLYTDLGQIAQVASFLLGSQITSILSVIVPISAIALTYAAVSGERQRGSLKLLLSQPYTRRDVVVGKFWGRFLALAAPLAGALVLQYLVALPEAGSDLDLTVIAATIGLTLLLGLTFTGFTLGASAATSTTQRSLIVAGGIWVYMFALWNSVSRGVGTLLRDNTDIGQETVLKLELFVKLVNPTQAYQTLLTSWAAADATVAQARAAMFGGLLGGRGARLRQQVAAQVLENSVPWYLSDAAAVGVLLFWCVVPVLIGLSLFSKADL